MADKKISQLTNLTGANLADNDEFAVVDTSATETKAITFGELKTALDTSTGFVRITGDTMTGDLNLSGADVTFGDNDKAIFGAGSDLQIYHDGSNSFIKDTGTGNLFIQGEGTVAIQDTGGVSMAIFNDNADVLLRYNGSTKLATTATGIDVTGTVVSDGLTVGTKAFVTSDANVGYFGGSAGQANHISFYDSLNLSRIYTNGTQRVRIDSGGDISFYEDTGTTPKFFWDASAEALYIGNTNPGFAGALDVTGIITARIASAGQTTNFNVRDPDNDDLFRISTDGTTGEARIGAYSDTTPFMTFYTVSSERMRIDSSGNVGIGTSSPASVLDAKGTITTSTLNVTAADQQIGRIDFRANDASTGGTGNVGSILVASNAAYTSQGRPGYMSFYTTSGTSEVERLRIDSEGNIGIGTTSPNSYAGFKTLTINGTSGSLVDFEVGGTRSAFMYYDTALRIGTNVSADTRFFINGGEKARIDSSGNLLVGGTTTNHQDGSTTEQFSYINGGYMAVSRSSAAVAYFNRQSTDGGIAVFRKDGSNVGSIGTTNGDLTIYSSLANHGGVRFAESGLLGTDNSGTLSDGTRDIGQTNFRWKDLYLSGDTFVGEPSTIGAGESGVTVRGLGQIRVGRAGTAAVTLVSFNNDNGEVGYILTNGSATTYATSSDYRLKEDVQPMVGATDRLMALKPVNFAWKADGSRVDGFLAHEAQEIVPEAVTGSKDAMRDEEYEVTPAVYDDDGNLVSEAVMGTRSVPDYQGIDQSKLVPLLTAALQEAMQKIETLEARVAALEA